MMNKTKQQKTEHRELASPNGQETGAVSLPSSVGSPDQTTTKRDDFSSC